jgi:hypothetical protein
MLALRDDTAEPSSHTAGTLGSLRKIVAVIVLSTVILALLLLVVSVGTAKWVADCYATHPGEHVRWTFPDGCQVDYGGTYLTVRS